MADCFRALRDDSNIRCQSLLPGNEEEAAGLLDNDLSKAMVEI